MKIKKLKSRGMAKFLLAIILGVVLGELLESKVYFLENKFLAYLSAIGIIIFLQWMRVLKRGYFWEDKEGEHLTFKQFLSRFREGVEGITPLQQVKTTLWSMIPVFGGVIWGIVMTFFNKTYWLTLILTATLPITSIQFISNLQKFWQFKRIEQAMKEAMENAR